MDSPNMARAQGDEKFKSFQNKGHFELVASNRDHRLIVDRSSRKQDLEDLKVIILSI